MTDEEAYHELSLYTLQKGDVEFLHQYVVDAYAAQHPLDDSKPIRVYFALAGLYLHIERGFTGKQVQLAHLRLAKERQPWPIFTPPATLGKMTVLDVLRHLEGADRDAAISTWSRSVWGAWHDQHAIIASLVSNALNI